MYFNHFRNPRFPRFETNPMPSIEDIIPNPAGGGGGNTDDEITIVQDLDDGQKAIIQKYEKEYEGIKFFNSNGDVVKEDGTVLIPKEKLTEMEGKAGGGGGEVTFTGTVEVEGKTYSLGSDGKAYDPETKKVAFTKEQLKEKGTQITLPEEVEIDGVKHKVNENGEVVDKDGKVVMSKEDLLKELEDQGVEDKAPMIETIQKLIGVEIKDENGNIRKFENTSEGLVNFFKEAARMRANEIRNDEFTDFPDVEEYLQFRKNGGTPQNYFVPSVDWSQVQIGDEESQHISVITSNLLEKGNSQEEANDLIAAWKDKGILKEKATNAIKELGKRSNDRRQSVLDQQAETARQNALKQEEHWKSVKQVVDSGKFGSFIIPEADRDKFYQYVAMDADGKGNSKYILDMQKLGLDKKLLLQYIAYKGFNFDALVKEKLDDFMSKSKSKKVITISSNKQKKNSFGGGDVSLDNLLGT